MDKFEAVNIKVSFDENISCFNAFLSISFVINTSLNTLHFLGNQKGYFYY